MFCVVQDPCAGTASCSLVYIEESNRNAPLPFTGWRVLGFEPQWGARFSGPIQTGPEAHPASCTLGTGSPYWG